MHKFVFDSIPDPVQVTGTHDLQPGDWVLVKEHVKLPLGPKFEGPFQVPLTTATAVK